MTRIRLIIYIEDPKKASSVDYIYIEEDIKIKETTIIDIIYFYQLYKCREIIKVK